MLSHEKNAASWEVVEMELNRPEIRFQPVGDRWKQVQTGPLWSKLLRPWIHPQKRGKIMNTKQKQPCSFLLVKWMWSHVSCKCSSCSFAQFIPREIFTILQNNRFLSPGWWLQLRNTSHTSQNCPVGNPCAPKGCCQETIPGVPNKGPRSR